MKSLENIRIPKQHLPQLRNLYKNDWPLHSVSFAAIEHFIDRFDKKPEWEEKVKFLTLNDGWQQSGTFVIVNENDRNIMFNTLEASPYPTLRRTLELLNYEQETTFVNFRDIFRPLVFDILRVRNLEATFDTGTRCIYFPREKAELLKEVKIRAPEGFHLGSIDLNQIEKVNSVWAQRSSHSLEFLTTAITENPSTGLYETKTGELIAWCLMLETGAMGNLQIDERYYGQHLYQVVWLAQLRKIAFDLNREIVMHVVHHNEKSFHLISRSESEWVDNSSWIGVKQKEAPKLAPLWGKL